MRESLGKKSIFDGVADLYDLTRPEYPNPLIDDLIECSGLNSESRILEIGSGTGILTKALAFRGFTVTGIELGSQLARKAKLNVCKFTNATILEGDFDTEELDPGSYDLVVAATSYHWLDPSKRSQKIRHILSENGTAAIIETRHIDRGRDTFPACSQKCYLKWDKNTTADFRLPKREEVLNEEFRYSSEFRDGFEEPLSKNYETDVKYTASEYRKLLSTYSDIIGMQEPSREGLLECLSDMIGNDFGGYITKSYLWQLFLIKKI